MMTWPYPRWIAHRGAGTLAPENTIAAFRLGASYGYRMFECDVKLSADGVPFLLHDTTLERTTNSAEVFGDAGDRIAGDQPWSALSLLDAGSWHSGIFTGEPLATMENVARFCRRNGFLLNIEIKPTPGLEQRTGEVVAAEAARLWHGAVAAPLLTSFDPEALLGARATAPQLPCGLLLDSLWTGWFEIALDLQCVAIVCKHSLWTAELVAQVHGAGGRCLSYTVNDEPTAQHLLQLGTDGLITDRIDLFPPI